jgi:hypothetical protein
MSIAADYQSVNRVSQSLEDCGLSEIRFLAATVITKQKPRVITPGLLAFHQRYCDTVCQTVFIIGLADRGVKIYFSEPRAEGGGVEPQWLMGRSPVWQTESSTHWQRPPDPICLGRI